MTDNETPIEITEDEVQEVIKSINADLSLMIQASAVETLKDPDETASLAEVIFLTTKVIIRTPAAKVDVPDIAPVVFGYYLSCYRDMVAVRDKREDMGNLVTEAALNLFDMYIKSPHDDVLRKCVILGAEGIGIILNEFHASRTDVPIRSLIGDLATVTLLTESVSRYVSGSTRRHNLPYIRYVYHVLKHVTADPTLAFFKDEGHVKVLSQVMKKVQGSPDVVDMTGIEF